MAVEGDLPIVDHLNVERAKARLMGCRLLPVESYKNAHICKVPCHEATSLNICQKREEIFQQEVK